MDKDSLIEVNKQVKALINLQGLNFGRAAGMAWVIIGSGDLKYSLHLDCCFRVRMDDEILVTGNEMNNPSGLALDRPGYDPDTFDWDVQGDNRYDEWASKARLGYMSIATVVDAQVNKWGDLTITLDQGILLEAFVDSSIDECWRLFKSDKVSPHYIVNGNGFEVCD